MNIVGIAFIICMIIFAALVIKFGLVIKNSVHEK